jgi:hypothetical protein
MQTQKGNHLPQNDLDVGSLGLLTQETVPSRCTSLNFEATIGSATSNLPCWSPAAEKQTFSPSSTHFGLHHVLHHRQTNENEVAQPQLDPADVSTCPRYSFVPVQRGVFFTPQTRPRACVANMRIEASARTMQVFS